MYEVRGTRCKAWGVVLYGPSVDSVTFFVQETRWIVHYYGKRSRSLRGTLSLPSFKIRIT